jgi:DNA polymerase III delta prime subunit
MIEVEVRGKIDHFEKTLEEFRKKAKFIEEKDRFTLLFARPGLELKEAIKKETLQNEKVDLKVRITNKKPEIVVKYGNVKGSESRKEVLIPINKEDFSKAVELFKFLEWNKGKIQATKTFVFVYNDIEFALVKSGVIDYFEAEKVIHDTKKEDADDIIREIQNTCKEFDLNPVNEDDFFDLLDEFNKHEDRLFDLTKQDLDDIKEKWKEYF